MKVAIIKERRAHERRVAASPDTVKHMTGMRLDVLVESGAGPRLTLPTKPIARPGRRSSPTRRRRSPRPISC